MQNMTRRIKTMSAGGTRTPILRGFVSLAPSDTVDAGDEDVGDEDADDDDDDDDDAETEPAAAPKSSSGSKRSTISWHMATDMRAK